MIEWRQALWRRARVVVRAVSEEIAVQVGYQGSMGGLKRAFIQKVGWEGRRSYNPREKASQVMQSTLSSLR